MAQFEELRRKVNTEADRCFEETFAEEIHESVAD